jgi:hypothetical protein
MHVDQLTDNELTTLTDLANRTWEPGFNGGVLPTKRQAREQAEHMRALLGMAAEVLQHDRAALTYAVQKMRQTPANVTREATITQALDTGLAWLEGQAALLREARDRMRCADARLRMAELTP